MQAVSSPATEQDWLSTEQQDALRERSNLMGLYLVAHAWALIFLAMALFALWPNPLSSQGPQPQRARRLRAH